MGALSFVAFPAAPVSDADRVVIPSSPIPSCWLLPWRAGERESAGRKGREEEERKGREAVLTELSQCFSCLHGVLTELCPPHHKEGRVGATMFFNAFLVFGFRGVCAFLLFSLPFP